MLFSSFKKIKMNIRLLFLVLLSPLTTSLCGQKEQTKTVYFDLNSCTLSKEARRSLDSISFQLKGISDFTLSLQGHTDDIGSIEYNERLSERRANVVKAYLTSKNIEAGKIVLTSSGERKPIVPNSSEANKALNRRVQLSIIISPPIAAALPEANPALLLNDLAPTNKDIEKKGHRITVPYGHSSITYDSSSTGMINITVITNTAEMEANKLTTMTVDDEPLASNLMICWQPVAGYKECMLKEPIKVRIPLNQVPSLCSRVSDIKLYDAEKDSLSGQIKWKEILPDFETEIIDGQEYFVLRITNVCISCKNFDCKPIKPHTGTLKLKSKKYTLTDVNIIYENANALLTGTEESKNFWKIKYFSQKNIESPTVKIIVKDNKGDQHTLRIKMKYLQSDNKGNFRLTKKQLKKVNP
jgi:hypothetical protein